jgi:hypothetical protein
MSKHARESSLQRSFEVLQDKNLDHMKIPLDYRRLKTFHDEQMSLIKEMLNYQKPDRFDEDDKYDLTDASGYHDDMDTAEQALRVQQKMAEQDPEYQNAARAAAQTAGGEDDGSEGSESESEDSFEAAQKKGKGRAAGGGPGEGADAPPDLADFGGVDEDVRVSKGKHGKGGGSGSGLDVAAILEAA